MSETWRSNFVTEDDIDAEYVAETVSRLTPILQGLTGKKTSQDEFLLRSTMYKVLIYINNTKLPIALEDTLVEMSARQLAEYEDGLSSKKGAVVKRIARGGFTQDLDTTTNDKAVPRGTQFLQDYSKILNRYRRMRIL
ncbi:TPA: hypothetical protein QCX06_002096 [Bacillus paranthracis]|nr:hypothetical protein [Bacillus paranthracis]HDR7304494.1 hypothetical protein [Bacillus paranthracis]